jgi:TM2 domain-containing membrane protein YozV
MNCANHPEIAATAYCRTCGKPLCNECQRTAMGTIMCEEHFAPPAGAEPPPAYSPYTSPYTAPPAGSAPSPGLAFILGLIPGVGAIYNGQYAKGLIHVVILGTLISILSSGAAGGLEPLFGMLTGLWFFYMPFEAYHTASKRQRGEPVDEFSSVIPLQHQTSGFPIAPLILIIVGAIFLLNNLEVIRLYQVMRYWPLFLILLGVYLLFARLTPPSQQTGVAPPSTRDASHE